MKRKLRYLISSVLSILSLGMSCLVCAAPIGGGEKERKTVAEEIKDDGSKMIIEEDQSRDDSSDTLIDREQDFFGSIYCEKDDENEHRVWEQPSVWKPADIKYVDCFNVFVTDCKPKDSTAKTYTFKELIKKLHDDGVRFYFMNGMSTSSGDCVYAWNEFFKDLKILLFVYGKDYFSSSVDGISELFEALNISFRYERCNGVSILHEGYEISYINSFGSDFKSAMELKKLENLFKCSGVCAFERPKHKFSFKQQELLKFSLVTAPGFMSKSFDLNEKLKQSLKVCDLKDLFMGFSFLISY